MSKHSSIPVAVTVAGSDCSGGAGLQADIKTFSHFGVYGLTVVTCVVSEAPGEVRRIQQLPWEMVQDQLELMLRRFPVAVVKTGMLFSARMVRGVAQMLAALPEETRPKLVVDPVMIATSGDPLIESAAVAAYQKYLFPLADVITPNLDEAAALVGREIRREDQIRPAAEALHGRHGCAVLVKGGHLRGRSAVDILRDARGFSRFSAPYVRGVSTHGTGCTYSAAIAANLARGAPLRESVRYAKAFVTRAIRQAFRWRHGGAPVDALNHLQSGGTVLP